MLCPRQVDARQMTDGGSQRGVLVSAVGRSALEVLSTRSEITGAGQVVLGLFVGYELLALIST